jgi:hypothetical protein
MLRKLNINATITNSLIALSVDAAQNTQGATSQRPDRITLLLYDYLTRNAVLLATATDRVHSTNDATRRNKCSA